MDRLFLTIIRLILKIFLKILFRHILKSLIIKNCFKTFLRGTTMGKGKKQRLVERRLLTYSAAAAGVLALAPAADAVVRYSGVKNLVVNSGNPSVKIDLNFDGVNDLSFKYVASGFAGVPAIYRLSDEFCEFILIKLYQKYCAIMTRLDFNAII